MKNPTTDILAEASAMLEAGTKIKVVLNHEWATEDGPAKLTYSQLWLYHTRRMMDPAEYITADPGSEEGRKAIAEARHANQSWGYIAVRCNKPEAQVRKQYAEATGTKSQGLRIGHGGRWVNNDPVLYLDEAKMTGTAIPVGTPRSQYRALVASHDDYLAGLPAEELRRRCRLLGLKENGSKAVLVKRLLAATDPANA
jgi:hypothetical protein